MTATEIIRKATVAGLTLAAKGEQLSVKPATLLSPDLRALLISRKTELLACLRKRASNPPTRVRAWTVLLDDGARITALNSAGADAVEMLNLAREQFGRSRVVAVEAAHTI